MADLMPFKTGIPGQVVHLIADRLRLKIPHLQQDSGYGPFLQAQLQAQAGIQAVGLNILAQSLTIQFHPETISVAALLKLLHEIGDLEISGDGNPAWTNLTRAFDLEPEQVGDKAQEFGSYLVGGQVGYLVGGMAGAAVAGATLGPTGLVVGTQLGRFVGGVVGGRVGLEAMQTLKQTGFDWQKLVTPRTQIPQSLEIRTSGNAGEVAGEITGGLVGGTLFGPTGEIVGQLMGTMVGGQMAEALGLTAEIQAGHLVAWNPAATITSSTSKN